MRHQEASHRLVTFALHLHNAEAHLEEALESLWQQSFQKFEVIAVDDGSSDRTAQILARHAGSRLRVLRLLHSGGANASVLHFQALQRSVRRACELAIERIVWGEDRLGYRPEVEPFLGILRWSSRSAGLLWIFPSG